MSSPGLSIESRIATEAGRRAIAWRMNIVWGYRGLGITALIWKSFTKAHIKRGVSGHPLGCCQLELRTSVQECSGADK